MGLISKIFYSRSRINRLLKAYWQPAINNAFIKIDYFNQPLSFGDAKNKLKLSFSGVEAIGYLKTIGNNGPFWEAWTNGKLLLHGDIWEAYQLISLCNGQWEKYIRNLSIMDAYALLSIPYDVKRNSWEQNNSKVDLAVYSSNEIVKFIGTPKMWSHTSFSSDSQTPEEAHSKRVNQCFEYLELDKKTSYLDIGCGWGTMITRASKRYPHLKVKGIVYNKDQLAYIEKRITDEKLENCTPIYANFLDIEDKGIGVFDSISCCEMFEHIPLNDRYKAVKLVHKLLKPGGKVWLQLVVRGCDDPMQRQNSFLDSYLQTKCLPQCNAYSMAEVDMFKRYFHFRTLRWMSQEDLVRSELEWLRNLGSNHTEWTLEAKKLAVISCFCALSARHNRYQVVIMELERRDNNYFLY